MNKHLLATIVAAPFILATSVANAYSYGFTQITSNGAPSIASQLNVEVTKSGENVLFKFTNSSIIASSITDIYFDYGTRSNPLYFKSISNNVLGASGESAGVSFSDGASPSNLPGGRAISFYADAGADSNSPVMSNGVNAANEYVKFLGELKSGITFDNVITGLNSNLFRIGLHVQAIGDRCEGQSESFINKNTPNPVPVPAAAWLFGSALLGFTSLLKRRKDTV